MSFIDNLESNLKSLENVSEKETGHDRKRREAERRDAKAVAPHAEALKKSPFVNEFLTHAVRIGHGTRTRIAPNWFGNTLRVDAKERRLELVPEADGIRAVYYEDGEVKGNEPLSLDSNPEQLALRWLDGIE